MVMNYSVFLGVRERMKMNLKISYNKLWKRLIDIGWSKTKLREESGISSSSLAKLGKGENVTTDVLLKICSVLDCGIEDIMETVKGD